jgi:hypothetical protein
MTDTDELASLCHVQLVQVYIGNIRSYEATEHIGLMSDENLRMRRFDRCEFDIQFT